MLGVLHKVKHPLTFYTETIFEDYIYKPLILPSHTAQHNLHPSSSWLQ